MDMCTQTYMVSNTYRYGDGFAYERTYTYKYAQKFAYT